MDSSQLNAPKGIKESVERDARLVEDSISSKKLRYVESKISDMAKDVSEKYEAWKKQTLPLRRKLVRWNEMLEGVVEETNFPFEGASNLTLHYAAGVASTFKATVNRTLYSDPDIFLVRGQAGSNSKELDLLQDAQNHTFHTESNGLDTLKNGTIPCFRDGALIVSGTWERRIERGHDSKIYSSASDFVNDYPDPESAGVSPEEYQGILDKFLVVEDFRFRSDFDYDFVEFDGPEWEIIPLGKFVFYPTYAPSIKRMEMYGKEYQLSQSEIEFKGKKNEYYEASVAKVIAQARGITIDEFESSRNLIEGLVPSTEEKKPVKLCDLVLKYDYDNSGTPSKFFLTFAPESKTILRAEKYWLRKNIDFCVDFRFQSRENRFIGVSLLGDTEDLFVFIDAIHNHRNNIRMLTTAPILLADAAQKEQLDTLRSENLIRPGVIFWVKEPDKNPIRQMQWQNLDQPGNSLDEENLIVRYIELRTGTTQGLSGRENPADPRAPMGKYLAQLNQSNMRIDDWIDEFRKGFAALGELNCALYYQFGPESLTFTVSKTGGPEKREINRNHFASPNLKWYMRKRSTVFSPEMAMQRIGGLIGVYAQLLPLLQQQDPKAIELWNRMVLSSGEPENEKLLIDIQQGGQINPMMLAMLLGRGIQPQQEQEHQAQNNDRNLERMFDELSARMAVRKKLVSPQEASRRLALKHGAA